MVALPPSLPAAAEGLIVPELFSAQTAAALPGLMARVRGPRVAIFHDAIALKYPELSPAKTVARFPAYLEELLAFDGIPAVSADSRDSLIDYWRWLGVTQTPPVIALPLGLEKAHASRRPRRRRSHRCCSAWARSKAGKTISPCSPRANNSGRKATPSLCNSSGSPTPSPAAPPSTAFAPSKPRAGPLRYDGAVDEAALRQAYSHCTFTVYPSLIEGFGLPALESLSYGKPCICSGAGALGESSREGGCLALAQVDAASIAAAIDRLLTAPGELERLATAASSRHFRAW